MVVISVDADDLAVVPRQHTRRRPTGQADALQSFHVGNDQQPADLGGKPSELGRYITNAMPAAGFSAYAQLARAAKISGSTLSRIINGGVDRPEPESLDAIAAALGVDPAELKTRAGYTLERAARPLHPLAAELDQMLADDSPLTPERRADLYRVVNRLMEADRADIVRRMRRRHA